MPDEEDIDCAASSCTWTWNGSIYGCCTIFVTVDGAAVLYNTSHEAEEVCASQPNTAPFTFNSSTWSPTLCPNLGPGPIFMNDPSIYPPIDFNFVITENIAALWRAGDEPGFRAANTALAPAGYEYNSGEFGSAGSGAFWSTIPISIAYYANWVATDPANPNPNLNSSGTYAGMPPDASMWVPTTSCPQDCACTGETPDISGAYDGETVSHECSGNCGGANCGPTETCCDGTTCVATDSFQTDNNRCGDCNTVCEAGYICVDGECVIDCAANSCTWTWTGEALGCCQTYTCTENGWALTDTVTTSENCSTGDSSCCDPGNVTCVGATYNVWNGSGPCTCGNVFLRCGGASVNEPGWQPPPPPYAWIVDTNTPNNSCAAGCASPVVGTACNNYGDGQEEPCNSSGGGGGGGGGGSWAQTATCPQDCACTGEAPTISGTYDGETVSHECTGDCACEEGDGPPDPDPDCDTPAPASVTKQPEMMPNLGPSIADGPCSQEECEAHVSTWMAEASGKPNEEGLYKVKWILLDGCPGACCSDQPTQPEFVKKSTLVDAPCKCGCS